MKELKARMTHKEWLEWLEYFNRQGRLSPVRMYDWGLARVAWIIAKAHGGKQSFEAFLPIKPGLQADNMMDDLDHVIKAFGEVKSGRTG